MKSRDFCYWLQGYIELTRGSDNPKDPLPNAHQWEQIKNHLAMVFKHEIDPSFGNEERQKQLRDLHSGLQQDPTIPGMQFNC